MPQPIVMNHATEVWKFRPHPLLANPHVQTIMAVHWPRRVAPYRATRHVVTLADGDQIVLHEDAPAQGDDTSPSVLLVHGLSGSFESTYMTRMAEKLTVRGYRVFRADMRGCGASEGLARQPAHCGLASDIASAIHMIAELYCDSPVSLVGYSLGGTLSLNMLADAGEMRVSSLEKTLVVCPPIDLFSCERNFRSSWGRWYDRFFVKEIWQQVVRRWQSFPDIAPAAIPRRPPRLRDIDDLVIAPSGGFTSAEHYYSVTQPGPRLASIRQPVTIVFSEDDPVVPCGPLFEYPHSDSIETIITTHGGHLGFLGARGVDSDFRWLDWRIIEWLADPRQRQTERTLKDHAYSA
jgi:predicted alpha/beta-fold hydrolase